MSLPGRTGTTYYVSATGSDAAAGTSPATAWQTLAKVNAGTYGLGDSILLKSGNSFTGTITVYGTAGGGTWTSSALHPVTIDVYGGSAPATITTTSNSMVAIDIYNISGVIVRNLILVGTGASNTVGGVSAFNDAATFYDFIWFENLTVSGFKNGIIIGGDNTHGFSNVSCLNCILHDNLLYGFQTYGGAALSAGTKPPNKNVFVHKTQGYNHPGNGSGGGIGIGVGWTDTATVQYCVSYANGSASSGPLGFFTSEATKTVFQYNESYNNTNGSGIDGDGFDFDGGTTESIAQYNYAHGNQGAGHLLFQSTGSSPWFNNTVRYNIFQNNASGSTNVPAEIAIGAAASNAVLQARVYNNILYNARASGFSVLFTGSGAGSTTGSFSNNILYGSGNSKSVDAVTFNPTVTFQGNDYFGNVAFRWNNVSYASIALWRAGVAGIETYNGADTSLGSDPGLTNVGAGGTLYPAATTTLNAYKFSGASPMIDVGVKTQLLFGALAPVFDYFGTTIPATIDVGAYEKP